MTPTSEKSLGELLGDLTRETSTLVRQEVQLAKAEITEKISAAIRGSVFLVVAALFGLFAFQALIITLILALSQVVAPWLAALIVGGVLLLIAGVCAAIGTGKLKNVTPVPRHTLETIKDDVQWAKEQMQ